MISLAEAGNNLTGALLKYARRDGWYFVALREDPEHPALIIYTRTRKEANSLRCFAGHEYAGYPVIAKAMGKIRPLAGPRLDSEG